MSQSSDSPSGNPQGGKRRRHPRYDFRAASHASAHAGDQTANLGAIPSQPMVSKEPATLVDTADALTELIQHLRQVGRFAYDSEFIGELSYFPKLCLIQVATEERVALIDSLADLDLMPFWELIADSSLEKIVHAGQQDLEPVFRHLGKPPANVFDTQVAAGFVGLAYPAGLSKLAREMVGVQLGKGFTFTHWDQRPLSAVQLRYAADDVRYLPALRHAIGQRLDALGHTPWAAAECATLCDPGMYRQDPASDFMRVRGANSLPPRNAAVLQQLTIWRDGASRRHDSPPRSFLRDEILIDMARNPTPTVADLARVRGLPRPVEETEGGNIISAINRGLATPKDQWPVMNHVEETAGERFSADALWAVVQAWCHGRQIDPNLAASRQEMGRFYCQSRQAAPVECRLNSGWRQQLLGDSLTRFLAGNMGIVLHWNQGGLQAEEEKDKGKG